MKVLIAFTDSDTHNPFVKELKEGLEQAGCEVTWSLNTFWAMQGNYDIIHLQWPEYLFPSEHPITDENIAMLEKLLMYWKKKAKIVLTRHNEQANYKDSGPVFQRIYQLAYSYCDGIIHLGPYGLKDFKRQHEKNILGQPILHKIIPHHVYLTSYPNDITQSKAREILHIKPESFVILVFGRIRYREERHFLKALFRQEREDHALFLIPSWFPFIKGRGIKAVLRRIYHHFLLFYMQRKGNVLASDKFVKDTDVQLYFNAADVVLLPRLDGLNSGNITLACFFRKILIGAEVGNIQYELETLHNPVFKTDHIHSVRQALRRARQLLKDNQGEKNYQYALANRHPFQIAESYYKFYQACLQYSDIKGIPDY